MNTFKSSCSENPQLLQAVIQVGDSNSIPIISQNSKYSLHLAHSKLRESTLKVIIAAPHTVKLETLRNKNSLKSF